MSSSHGHRAILSKGSKLAPAAFGVGHQASLCHEGLVELPIPQIGIISVLDEL